MSKQRHRMAVAAHVFLTDEQNQVLFMRRANTGYADGHWSIPAGHVELGETIIAACIRETAEELGVELREDDLQCVLVQHKHDFDGEERIDVFFVGALPIGAEVTIAESDKCDGLAWCPADRLPCPMVDYVKAAIGAIRTPGHQPLNYYGFEAATTG